jgi:hypothetical protein
MLFLYFFGSTAALQLCDVEGCPSSTLQQLVAHGNTADPFERRRSRGFTQKPKL